MLTVHEGDAKDKKRLPQHTGGHPFSLANGSVNRLQQTPYADVAGSFRPMSFRQVLEHPLLFPQSLLPVAEDQSLLKEHTRNAHNGRTGAVRLFDRSTRSCGVQRSPLLYVPGMAQPHPSVEGNA